MPSERELSALPYFAILALGARAARLAEPLLREWEGASDEHAKVLDDALKAIEELVSAESAEVRGPLWNPSAAAALRAANVASEADEAEAPVHALLAADSVAELADAIDPARDRERAARAVSRSIRASTNALMECGGKDVADFRMRLARDIEKLGELAQAGGWTDETGVPVGVLGG